MKHLQNNRSLLILAIIVLFAQVKGTPEWAATEDGTKYLIESKYEYTWFEALHECAKRNLSLVAVDTADKNFHLVKLLKNRFGIGLDLWIGSTASTAEHSSRKFVWVSNGKTFNFANWEDGEPNNLGGDQPCVHTWSKTNNFNWADGQWHLKYGYICEETFISHYRHDMDKKRHSINEVAEQLILYFKEKQKHIEQINQAQDVLLKQINLELEEKLQQTKKIIDNILEEH
ncbi:lectin subunit alpha [Calliphora vicina]|uniref:lectin subunit alpha n=1 Tax=Calliphora vicina TaxID=7373 RepID=UPI00325A5F87